MFIKNTNGFTLLEVLVALVILSVGLLGLAGLHLSGLQGNQGALLRTQAALITNDLAARMRANRPGVAANNYASNVAAPSADYSKACADFVTVDCNADTCSSAEMSSFDVADFICAIQAAIPNKPIVNVTCVLDATGNTCAKNSAHTITINWTQRLANPKAGKAGSELKDLANNNSLSLVVRP